MGSGMHSKRPSLPEKPAIRSETPNSPKVSASIVAASLAVTDRHVVKLALDGEIPGILVGSIWRFDLDEVLAALEDRTRRIRKCRSKSAPIVGEEDN